MFRKYIEALLDREGGYINHPADRGGPTSWGITRHTWIKWQMKHLSRELAAEIYHDLYWKGPKIHLLPSSIREQVFDMSVNHGPRVAIKMLQNAVGVVADGLIGPNTITAAERWDGVDLNNTLASLRVDFYKRIVNRDSTQKVFLKGWLKRANSFRRYHA